jgi:heme A synthase
VRRAAVTASAMMVVEALLGAALVKLDLVGMNASLGRAVVMPLHLLSTSVLLGALSCCWWWGRREASLPTLRGPRQLAWASIAAVLLTSTTGALTALGDTVYPVKLLPVAERLAAEQAPAAHFLERLRVVHPLVAVLSALLLFSLASRGLDAKLSRGARAFARALLVSTCVQVGLGSLNVWLSAPGWLQVVHLLAASCLWLALVLLTSELYAPRAEALLKPEWAP